MLARLRALLASIVVACAACSDAATPAAAHDAAPGILAAFSGTHPLARAQALEAEGRHAEAVAAAQTALADDPQLADLCFDRFTLGGAEIVLTPCAPISGAARTQFVRERSLALAAMPDVVYAEPNLVAGP